MQPAWPPPLVKPGLLFFSPVRMSIAGAGEPSAADAFVGRRIRLRIIPLRWRAEPIACPWSDME
jgi:hypothetical protein